MMRCLLLVYVFLMAKSLIGQTDSVVVIQDRPDAIYLTYGDFRTNTFISKEMVDSDLKKEQLDFMSKVLSAEKFEYNIGSVTHTAEPKNIWGFYQNKTLYVKYRDEFFRVPVFGAICYLVATVTVINAGFYDPMSVYGVSTSRSKEIREFLINFYDGVVADFTASQAETLLSRDAALFAEYKNLSRKNRKEQLNRYIRKFNEAHPVYFLK